MRHAELKKILLNIWGLTTALDRRKLGIVSMLVLLMTLIESMGVISIMPFLAVLASPQSIESNLLIQKIYTLIAPQSKRDFIIYLGLMSLGIVVISAAVKIITLYYLNRFSSLQRHYFATRLLNIYLKQNYIFFIQRNSSELIKILLSDLDQVVWGIIRPLLLIISYSCVIFAMIVILIFYDPIMALSTAFMILSFYSIMYVIVRSLMSKISHEYSVANRERYQSCNEVFGGIKDVIINNAESLYQERFNKNSRIFSRHLATQESLSQIPLYVIETIGYGCLILLAIYLVVQKQEVETILPILGLYGVAAYRMLPAAQIIYRSFATLKFSEHILDNVVAEFEINNSDLNNYKADSNISFNSAMELHNVSFVYPTSPDRKVIDNFNLLIEKNASVGIVGKSGSGKSTLMDMMLGLLLPSDGNLVIDGQIIDHHNVKAWQRLLSYVPQDIYLADTSILQNIAFGIPIENIDINSVYEAAKMAQIHDFIVENLEQGYNTLVGERGLMLSGGQRQRLGIARALYKKPKVLFMDEATSALDVETEKAVNDAIQALNGKLTIIIIAHRYSAVAHCDRIIKL